MSEKDVIYAYVDGACRGNPGPAGVGAVISIPLDHTHEICEYIGPATNNVAELSAIEHVLDWVIYQRSTGYRVRIFSDSRYAIGVLTNPSWRPKKNVALIERIKRKVGQFASLEISYVPGEDNPADILAKTASQG